MTESASNVFRDFNTPGVPASGEYAPEKVLVRRWGRRLEDIIAAAQAGAGNIYANVAALNADLVPGANTMAMVVADATAENNGIYRKVGATTTGSWVRDGNLFYSFIKATDAGAGTPNAIQATTDIAVSESALIWTNIFEANTATAPTIAFNAGSALTIKRQRGGDFLAGELPPFLLGFISGSTFQSVFDVPDESTLAAIEGIAENFGDLDGAMTAINAAVTDAETAETNAEAAEAAAEAARDAILAAGPIYADTAAGLADTSEDDYFLVPSTASYESFILYRHDSGPVATAIKAILSAIETFGVSIYKSDGIATGDYYADRRSASRAVYAKVYAEIIDGDASTEVEFQIQVNGSNLSGVLTVEEGTPVDETGLFIEVDEEDEVNVVITSITGGAVRDLFVKVLGASGVAL